MGKLNLLIQTSKDRLRYLDTTFNSVTKVLPTNIDIYIACDQPSEQLLKYLTSNDYISLEDQYLYPNENASWKRHIGEIENKKNVKGIVGKYKKLLLQDSNSHMYEKIISSLNTVIVDDNDNDYIIYIEDDVIFKENFYETILKCIQEMVHRNIGRVAMYKHSSYTNKSLLIQEKKTGWCGSNVCLLLSSDVLRKINLHNYSFSKDHLPTLLQQEIKNSIIYPQSGSDEFLTSFLRKHTNTAIYTSDSICQHIGVLSAMYENIISSKQKNTSLSQRSFFDEKNNIMRIDRSCITSFVL